MNYLLLFDVYRLGVRRENIACVANGRWERWRVDSLLGRSKIDGYSNGRDVDRLWTIRYCYLLLIIGAGCAEIPVFLEVRLIVALDLADGLDLLGPFAHPLRNDRRALFGLAHEGRLVPVHGLHEFGQAFNERGHAELSLLTF